MKKGSGGGWRPWLISFSIGLAISAVVLCANSFWDAPERDIFRLLSDACITSAAFVGGPGLLAFAAGCGAFDILFYGVRQFLRHFRPGANRERYQSFYEYRQAKERERRPVAHMLAVGAVFFLLSCLFSFLWQKGL